MITVTFENSNGAESIARLTEEEALDICRKVRGGADPTHGEFVEALEWALEAVPPAQSNAEGAVKRIRQDTGQYTGLVEGPEHVWRKQPGADLSREPGAEAAHRTWPPRLRIVPWP
jgi:hypothetical protein